MRERSRALAGEAALAALALPDGAPPRAVAALRDAILDLVPTRAPEMAPREIGTRLSGEPILERGLSRSVAKNQERSLLVARVGVFLLLALLFRSFYLAFISVLPSTLALTLVLAGMGLLGLRIDIGTSLVSSIATGTGSDFTLVYLWYLRRSSSPDKVVREVGPVLVISALLISAGLGSSGWGTRRP